jgi:hypothetical protein
MMRLLLTVLTLALAMQAPQVSAQVERRSFLFKDARGELAQALARGDTDVLLVIASMPGMNGQVAREITGLGGSIQFQDDDVDYIRALVPLQSVEGLVAHSGVHSADISIQDRSRAFGMANEEGETIPVLPSDTIPPVWPPVLSDYPLTNRYNPIGDLRALEFLEENPTYDGRGVKIAMIDMNPDMLLPELQVAKTLDGQSIPKIVAWGTALDIEVENDGRWVRMDEVVDGSTGQIAFNDTTFTAPRAGSFRMGMFDEALADTAGTYGSQGLDQDVNRDENPEGSSRLFGVLWDEGTDDVWVDTDQDLDFTDEKALTDYSVRPEFGVFGTDDPETDVRESIGFGISIDETKKLVSLNLGIASHASLVVGAAVGSRGTDGRFDGVAPGAQLISVSEGGAAYGQTESTIISVKKYGAEVVYFEQSSLITRNYLLRDGRLVPTVIYERLVDKYGPSILSPTHNYPILGGIDDFVMAKGVIGVNGHESKDNFFTNHGVRVEHDDNLLITGGYGPMGNGALKPDIISPSNYVSTSRGFLEGRAMPGLFQLPPGYTIAGGTSTATPTAAGATALLISAAKQAGVDYDAYRIKHAITRGARWVDHLAAYKQGNGVFSVAGAWEILKELDAGGQMMDITAQAPVLHPYSHLLPTPHMGEGLYERDGWNVGDRGDRTMTLTRTSGPRGSLPFEVSWAGNGHGTFSSPATVALPLNQAVQLPITIEPKEHGAHTAHLTLSHPSVPGYAFRTLATIVVAQPISAADGFAVETKAEVPRPGIKSFFYRVPEGVSALKFEVSHSERAVSMSVSRPDTRSQRGEQVVPAGSGGSTQVVANPMPGVWEVRLTDVADTRTFDWEQAKKDEPVPPSEATLKVTALATELSAIGGGVGSVHDFWITNRMASFKGGAVSTPVGSARREKFEIAEREQKMFEVEVLPGSTEILIRTRSISDPEADLDVYLFDCTDEEGECSGARTDADPVGDEYVRVANPAAGTWMVVVDGASVPSGQTTVEYLDVVLNPAYGMVSIVDLPQERDSDARWIVKAHTWLGGVAPEPGRERFAALLIQGQAGGDAPFMVDLWELPISVKGEAEGK